MSEAGKTKVCFVPQLGRPSIFFERLVLVKADIQDQNIEFSVLNGC